LQASLHDTLAGSLDSNWTLQHNQQLYMDVTSINNNYNYCKYFKTIFYVYFLCKYVGLCRCECICVYMQIYIYIGLCVYVCVYIFYGPLFLFLTQPKVCQNKVKRIIFILCWNVWSLRKLGATANLLLSFCVDVLLNNSQSINQSIN